MFIIGKKKGTQCSKFCVKDSKFCSQHKINKKCIHGIIKYYCKECCGSLICEHNKQKFQCKECCGSSICEHNNFKTQCKKCNGT